MLAEDTIAVEVAYAGPEGQWLLRVDVPRGATIADAIRASGIGDTVPGIASMDHKVGIFGRLATPANVLEAGDRVEIYRELVADPKEGRRQRAARERALRKKS